MSAYAETRHFTDMPKRKAPFAHVDRRSLYKFIDEILNDNTPQGEYDVRNYKLIDLIEDSAWQLRQRDLIKKSHEIVQYCPEIDGVYLTDEQKEFAAGNLEAAHNILMAFMSLKQTSFCGAITVRHVTHFATACLHRLAALGLIEMRETLDKDGHYFLMNELTAPWMRLAALTTNIEDLPRKP